MQYRREIIFIQIILFLVIAGIMPNCRDGDSTESFIIYYADPNKFTIEPDHIIQINKNLDLKEKMQLLADSVSSFKFGSLPIDVDTIKMVGEKKIAVINLRENPELDKKSRNSWSRTYFQGSTGGWCTSSMLSETLLQLEYNGEWVDGIQFFYEYDTFDEWDHVGFNGIQYRGQSK